MNTDIKDAASTDIKFEIPADLTQETFEIEDISELNLYAPVSISFCSSCCSSSS